MRVLESKTIEKWQRSPSRSRESYAVDVLHDGSEAGDQALCIDYDAAVLDLMLPGRSGFQVLRDLRARKADLPVLVLTAKDAVEERIAGLDAGADDYMIKPFVLAEVSARLRALLRRGQPHQVRFRVANLELDVARRTVTREGRRIDLRPREYSLLEFLMRNSDRQSRDRTSRARLDIHFDSISTSSKSHQFAQEQDRPRVRCPVDSHRARRRVHVV